MTKKERIERRLANRTKRQERKKLRREKLDELMTKVKQAPDFPEDGTTPDYTKNFRVYWPVVKAGLVYAETAKITRPKMDLQIQKIIALGDSMAASPVFDPDSEFILNIQKTWRIIRTILIAITVFITNENKDDMMDKLIEIGDWITGLDGDD